MSDALPVAECCQGAEGLHCATALDYSLRRQPSANSLLEKGAGWVNNRTTTTELFIIDLIA